MSGLPEQDRAEDFSNLLESPETLRRNEGRSSPTRTSGRSRTATSPGRRVSPRRASPARSAPEIEGTSEREGNNFKIL